MRPPSVKVCGLKTLPGPGVWDLPPGYTRYRPGLPQLTASVPSLSLSFLASLCALHELAAV